MLELKSNRTLHQTAIELGFSSNLIKLFGLDNQNKEFPKSKNDAISSIYLPPGVLGCYCYNKKILVCSLGIWKFNEGRSLVKLFRLDKIAGWTGSDSTLDYSSDPRKMRFYAASSNSFVKKLAKVLNEKSYIRDLWDALERK